MKKNLFLIILMVWCGVTWGHDTIIYFNQNVTVAKIIDETDLEITFNKIENQGGPDYLESITLETQPEWHRN